MRACRWRGRSPASPWASSRKTDGFAVLSDILGDEDHLGDMDFKVAGTEHGVTALQMDIKITSITEEIMRIALDQARDGRLHILGEMAKALTGARDEVSDNAPRITTITIPKDKIREVIGSGGKVIREITETTGAKIDIEDDGTIKVAAVDADAAQAAIDWIRGIVAEPELGVIYNGKVVKIVDFGAFVNFLGARDGLVHISELAPQRVGKVTDVVKVGDQVKVKVLGFDDRGKVKLSMRQVDQETGEDLGTARRHGAGAAARREPTARAPTPPRPGRPATLACRAASPCCRRSSAIAARRRTRRKTRSPGSARRKALGCALGRVRRAADRRRRAGRCCHDARLDRTTDGSGRGLAPAAGGDRATRCRRAGSARAFAGERVPTPRRGAGARCASSASAPISRSRPSRGRDRAHRRARSPPALDACAGRAAAAADIELSPTTRWPRSRALTPAIAARRCSFDGVPRDWRGSRRAARLRDDQCRSARRSPRRSSPRVRAAGYPVLAYTVNDPARARHLFDWGVTSVFSDAPDIILAASGTPRAGGRRAAGSSCGEAAQSAGDFRTRGAAAGRRRQGHLGLERRKLRRLGGVRRRRHVLRRQRRQLRRRRRARSRRSITAAPGASATRS